MNATWKNKLKSWIGVGMAGALALMATGCANLNFGRTQQHRGNSLFKFLYPEESAHVDTPTIPTLSLPLRVGVAFVPTDENDRYSEKSTLTETHKIALLKQVSQEFKSYPFVKSIEVIPTTYLTPRGGFANLDQLRTMYDIDVMALVSYDQTQFTDQGILSLTYWTVVGAYIVPTERNETRTMLDSAVYDIASRKLLFRAPGISAVKGSSALIYQPEELRRDSEKGFQIAATNLVTELKAQLEEFRDRVKTQPAEYKVVHKPGYTGGGAIGGIETAFVAACAGIYFWRRQKG